MNKIIRAIESHGTLDVNNKDTLKLAIALGDALVMHHAELSEFYNKLSERFSEFVKVSIRRKDEVNYQLSR